MFDDPVSHFYDAVIRRPLASLYRRIHGPALGAVLYLVGAGAIWYLVAGRTGLLSWPAAIAVLGGAVVVFAATWAWVQRTRPLVALAQFVVAGTAEAAAEASGLHDLVKSEIAAVGAQTDGLPAVLTRSLAVALDSREEAKLARKMARSVRSPVIVTGAVRVAEGVSAFEVRILSERPQGAYRPAGSETKTKLVEATPRELEVARETMARQAAVTARLALGIALMEEGRLDSAEAVFTSGGAEARDPLTLFYAAYTAYLRDDHRTAYLRAMDSFVDDPWEPAGALTTVCAYLLGQEQHGRQWAGFLQHQDVRRADPSWHPWLQLLVAQAHLTDLVITVARLGDAFESLAAEVREKTERMSSSFDSHLALIRARARYGSQDYAGVLATLDPWSDLRDPDVFALLAVAGAHLNRPEARRWAAQAAELLAEPAGCGGLAIHSFGYLAEAYAFLGEASPAAHWWDQHLSQAHLRGADTLGVSLRRAPDRLEPVHDSAPTREVLTRWQQTYQTRRDEEAAESAAEAAAAPEVQGAGCTGQGHVAGRYRLSSNSGPAGGRHARVTGPAGAPTAGG